MLQVLATLFVVGIGLCDWTASAENTFGQAHFESMMSNVKQIASELGHIYDSPCGPQECRCSQDLCMPLLEDNNPSCLKSLFNTSNIYNCSSFLTTKLGSTTQVCPSVMITTSRSSAAYVRTDVNAAALGTQQSAICRTQQLDPLFNSLSANSPYYARYFIQTISGGFRSYPGREEMGDSCLAFDGRTRPWFSSISVPNHLVVVIDHGYSMGGNADTWELYSRLTYAQKFALSLVDTVYVNYVNVVSFGGNDISSQSYETPIHVNFDPNNPQNHPELEPLKEKINLLTVSQNDTDASDFANALKTALRAFNESHNSLANVVIFTDGSFTSGNFFSDPSITSILDQMVNSNVQLFIYGINAGISGSGLQALSKSVNSTFQNIIEFSNPLFTMQSYLGYLAGCHRNLYGETGFWSRNYKDYFNVGYALTVALPAFSKNGSFIGVAAINLVKDELGPDEPQNTFRKDFEAAVEAQRIQQDKVQAGFDAKAFLRPAVPSFFDDSSCVYNMQSGLLCVSGQRNSKESLNERRCCNSCRDFGGGGTNKRASRIELGSVFGVLGLAVVVITATFWLRRYQDKQGNVNREESRITETESVGSGLGLPTGTNGEVLEMKTHKPTMVIPSQVRKMSQKFAIGTVEVHSNEH
ncbi:hypothetical protein R1sor_021908 [Riccia sorocarpa]|uniref:VWFA domain-containing protein n=1 Tax=Riccia sorocarpa TaxID=122646 RepID=A0ABD3GLB7_9MARC